MKKIILGLVVLILAGCTATPKTENPSSQETIQPTSKVRTIETTLMPEVTDSRFLCYKKIVNPADQYQEIKTGIPCNAKEGSLDQFGIQFNASYQEIYTGNTEILKTKYVDEMGNGYHTKYSPYDFFEKDRIQLSTSVGELYVYVSVDFTQADKNTGILFNELATYYHWPLVWDEVNNRVSLSSDDKVYSENSFQLRQTRLDLLNQAIDAYNQGSKIETNGTIYDKPRAVTKISKLNQLPSLDNLIEIPCNGGYALVVEFNESNMNQIYFTHGEVDDSRYAYEKEIIKGLEEYLIYDEIIRYGYNFMVNEESDLKSQGYYPVLQFGETPVATLHDVENCLRKAYAEELVLKLMERYQTGITPLLKEMNGILYFYTNAYDENTSVEGLNYEEAQVLNAIYEENNLTLEMLVQDVYKQRKICVTYTFTDEGNGYRISK